VIVLSDGADVGSSATLEQVLRARRNAHVRVSRSASLEDVPPVPLQQMAAATAGRSHGPTSPADLQTIFPQLGLQLAHEYILTYNSISKPGSQRPESMSLSAGVGATEGRRMPAGARPPETQSSTLGHRPRLALARSR
jgi:hypothetical protein